MGTLPEGKFGPCSRPSSQLSLVVSPWSREHPVCNSTLVAVRAVCLPEYSSKASLCQWAGLSGEPWFQNCSV